MSVAPSSLPPVRADDDGPTKTRKRKRDRDWLCLLAVVLGLAGVFPHAVDGLTRLVLALRGAPVAAVVAPEGKADATEQERQRGEDQESVHAAKVGQP